MSIIMFLVLAFGTPCESEDSTNCTSISAEPGTSYVDVMGLTIELDGI